MSDQAFYGDQWFGTQVDESYASAKKVLARLWNFYQPTSIIDVGCGRGAWLKACHELGATQLSGFDGRWNSKDKMIDPSIRFTQIDLNKPLNIAEKAHLCVSLEVAEHLQPNMGGSFVSSLVKISDVVLFSAAYSGQGGHGHVNEQPNSYWGKLFAARGFTAFDLVRPTQWADDGICYWYRQNSFLYVKDGHRLQTVLEESGVPKLTEIAMMDAIHPNMFQMHYPISFLMHVKALYPSFLVALKRRLNRHAEISS